MVAMSIIEYYWLIGKRNRGLSAHGFSLYDWKLKYPYLPLSR